MPARHAGLRLTRNQPAGMYSGLSMMVVSNISVGAGSVAVSKRPSLPATLATSGVAAMTLSCHDITRWISFKPVLGSITGMYNKLPSLSGGMNSRPNPVTSPATRG